MVKETGTLFNAIYFWDLLGSGGARYVSKTYKNSAPKKENKKAKKFTANKYGAEITIRAIPPTVLPFFPFTSHHYPHTRFHRSHHTNTLEGVGDDLAAHALCSSLAPTAYHWVS